MDPSLVLKMAVLSGLTGWYCICQDRIVWYIDILIVLQISLYRTLFCKNVMSPRTTYEKRTRGTLPRVMQTHGVRQRKHGNGKLSVKHLMTDLWLTEEQIETLPVLARVDGVSVNMFLTKELVRCIESELENPGVIGDMALSVLMPRWKDEKIANQSSKDLRQFPVRLALTSGKIDVIYRLVAMRNQSAEHFLSNELAVDLRGLIEAYVSEGYLPEEEGSRMYKIWSGDDSIRQGAAGRARAVASASSRHG